ncbi:hypothetical protein ACRZ5S_18010 [Vibrio scophthalmi]|uniref:Uncharacterized protein n=1 Tax=Vibrio sinensis TaxID=2302434 RepID=A0A3A6R3J0_9VIBR|nr:hypothetical protein [Vibrio sinensis]RJX75707.1 hypothetical protein DZ860_03260 [Vibrio sinensis]
MNARAKRSVTEGQIYPTKHYGNITVVQYKNAKEVLVKFEKTGFETVTTAAYIRSGMGIRDPMQPYGIEKKPVPDDMQAGTVYESNLCGRLIIQKYTHVHDVKVKFIDTGHIDSFSASNIRKGAAYDPMAKNTYGVGFMGIGKYNTNSPAHQVWRGILSRCYSDKYPSYKDVKVAEVWHNFQNFAEWFENLDWKGKAVDKDLLALGRSKVYSPDRCVLLTKSENSKLNTLGYIKLLDDKEPFGKCRIVVSKTFDELDDAIDFAVQNELALRAEILKKINKVDPLKDAYGTIKARLISRLKEGDSHE